MSNPFAEYSKERIERVFLDMRHLADQWGRERADVFYKFYEDLSFEIQQVDNVEDLVATIEQSLLSPKDKEGLMNMVCVLFAKHGFDYHENQLWFPEQHDVYFELLAAREAVAKGMAPAYPDSVPLSNTDSLFAGSRFHELRDAVLTLVNNRADRFSEASIHGRHAPVYLQGLLEHIDEVDSDTFHGFLNQQLPTVEQVEAIARDVPVLFDLFETEFRPAYLSLVTQEDVLYRLETHPVY